jgi:tRNA threonylcarbamoyladenosine modification (KEOPS) complex  Pcc1 subunit
VHRALLEVALPSSIEAQALYYSLKPESISMSSRGLRSSITLEGTRIEIVVEASTLSKLRAALNSYLRWLASFKEVTQTLCIG